MKNKLLLNVSLGLLTFICTACQSPQQNLESKKEDAATKIKNAEQKVDTVRAKEEEKIKDAQGPKVDEAKIDATEKIADAQRKVDDEKVKATEKIADAEQKAKEDLSPKLP